MFVIDKQYHLKKSMSLARYPGGARDARTLLSIYYPLCVIHLLSKEHSISPINESDTTKQPNNKKRKHDDPNKGNAKKKRKGNTINKEMTKRQHKTRSKANQHLERRLTTAENELQLTILRVSSSSNTSREFRVRSNASHQEYNVTISETHKCDCKYFKRWDKALCKHILKIQMDQFNLERGDKRMWQLGWTKQEISKLFKENKIQRKEEMDQDDD
eukprot:963305_1